jgi:chromosome segregation ATPase
VISASDDDLAAKHDENFGQIDLLWANYRKHRDAIRALEAKDKTFQTALARAEGSIKTVQGKVSALETAVAGQEDVATRVTELDLQLQASIKQMRDVVDRANSAYQMASRLEASLGADVAKIKSDITGLPVSVLHTSEAASLGVAMLAGWATGVYASLTEAAEQLIKLRKTFTPRAERSAHYQQQLTMYGDLYQALRPVYRAMTLED